MKQIKTGANRGTCYTIISRPHHILFECPHCRNEVEVPFQDIS